MEAKNKDLLSNCSELDFGDVNLADEEKQFRSEMNKEVISLCASLPKSTQADALLLFMRYFKVAFGQELSFFTNYYAPSWSIIYWLIQSCPEGKRLELNDIENARTAHSMALLLHPIDDHLNDYQWPATHLALLLRSQLWMIMNTALNNLADGIDGGEEIVRGFLDDYYSGIRNSKEIFSLDSYCDLFRKQMATGFIAPVLIIKKRAASEEFAQAIQTAYGSFGIAWRLLDDINDIETDMKKGVHSSVYTLINDNIRILWNKTIDEKNHDIRGKTLDYVMSNGIVERIKKRICDELNSAACIADECNMTGLADEFRCLLKPIKNSLNE